MAEQHIVEPHGAEFRPGYQEDRDYCLKYDLRFLVHLTTLEKDGSLVGRFRQVDVDEDTRAFMQECHDQFNSRIHHMKVKFMRPFVSMFYTHTDLNAILNTGQMHMFSTDQLRTIFWPGTERQSYPGSCDGRGSRLWSHYGPAGAPV